MDISAEALAKTNFSTVDWVIVICYPLISVVLGIVAARFIANMKDFVTAGQSLGTALGVATLTGTELGLITVMYSAQKGFTGGFAAFHIALMAGIATFIVGSTGFLIYRLRAMRVLTIPEFYRRRFGRKTQILGGVMMAFGGVLNMGLFLKVGSMFLVGITGLSHTSWALPTIMVFLLTLVLIYTALGGMISVVLADYVQFVVLSFGLLLTTFLAVRNLGWANIFDSVRELMGDKGFDPTIAEGGFGIEYMVWMAFGGLVSCAVWPTSVARALAAESPKTVKKQFMWGSVSYLIRFLIPYFWGICAFVFIMTIDADLKEVFFPAEGDVPADRDLYAMPIYLGRILPAGLIGIISAGMIAAFMSTHDSYLLCWSSVLTQDVIAPLMGDRMGMKTRVLLSRILIVVIGLYVLAWGLFYKGGLDIWDYMLITGAIYFAGAFTLLTAGLYWRRASSTGAVLALVTSVVAIFGLTPVQELVGIEMSAARVGLFSVAITLSAMLIGSLLFPDKKQPPSEAPETT
jgi:SSS family solute:Na+ symporter